MANPDVIYVHMVRLASYEEAFRDRDCLKVLGYDDRGSEMKILMDDGMQIQLGTGIGRFSKYLYDAMKKNGCDISLVDTVERTGNKTRDRFKYIKYINSKQFQHDIERYDVVLFSNYTIPVRKNRKTKYVAVIPDMVAFLYPETLPLAYRYYNQFMIKNTVEKTDLIFTISNSVKKEIIQKFPKSKEKLRFTWLGICEGIQPLDNYNPYENKKLSNIDESPFFLFVSTVEKRKNVGFMLDAFIQLKKACPYADRYKLVIVGRPGYGYNEFVNKAYDSGYTEDIIFAGYTSDADCNRLYNHARAFIFPTIYEGFGFAQIECMRCHLPIILSDIPINREISREYGNYFSLSSTESLEREMAKIAKGEYPYAQKNRLADVYLKDFDWNKIAQKYIRTIIEL